MQTVLAGLAGVLGERSGAPVYVETPPATGEIFQTMTVEAWREPAPGLWKATVVFRAYAPSVKESLEQAQRLSLAVNGLTTSDAYTLAKVESTVPEPMLDADRKTTRILAELAGYKKI